MYYFKYAVQNSKLSALFMLEGSIACIVGMLFLKKITERTGKRTGMILLLAGYSIFSAIFFYIPVEQTVLVFVGYFLISLFFGPMMPLISPSSREIERLSTAVNPPKRLVKLSVSRSLLPRSNMGNLLPHMSTDSMKFLGHPLPFSKQTSGPDHQNDQHQYKPVNIFKGR